VVNLAVGKPQAQNDLHYHHSFALFQIYAAIINIPICIYWAGGAERVTAILTETSPLSIILVVLFSIIWGVGTLLFGLACKIAGVGLGTNLSMGIIAVIGTLLPLIVEGTLISIAGAVICVGLVICCGGLWLSTKALALRDEDESVSVGVVVVVENVENGAVVDGGENVDTATTTTTTTTKYPTWKKVGICVATGICAVQLQFAFILGQEITDLTLEDSQETALPGSTHDTGGAAIIWLLAISLGAPVAIFNGFYSSPVPLSSVWKAPLSRHFKVILTTSIPWLAHIHIYGVCTTTLLPEKVAASIGWPMLMMITTGQALMLSIYLGEWKVASAKTLRMVRHSLLTTALGITILMTSVVAPM
jgi:L-rhamnose-H+ transport protein